MKTIIKQVKDLKFGDIITADQLLPRRLFASYRESKSDALFSAVMTVDEQGMAHYEQSGPEGLLVEAGASSYGVIPS